MLENNIIIHLVKIALAQPAAIAAAPMSVGKKIMRRNAIEQCPSTYILVSCPVSNSRAPCYFSHLAPMARELFQRKISTQWCVLSRFWLRLRNLQTIRLKSGKLDGIWAFRFQPNRCSKISSPWNTIASGRTSVFRRRSALFLNICCTSLLSLFA